MSSQRTKYALVGTGSRSWMFTLPILKQYKEYAELVALCDMSSVRLNQAARYLSEDGGGGSIAAYTADAFDDMIRDTAPDVVIVTTTDASHDTYIVRALELGCDVITEKPMTTDEVKAQAILDAVKRTGRRVRVSFNYRYMPPFSTVKEIVRSGAIGVPTLVDFQWRLDTSHGADYFRRWHREKRHSGGLLVHKATHHFDLVNWILEDHPAVVNAFGKLAFYGERNAKERGETYSYERYHGHATPDQDPFALVSERDEHGYNAFLDAEHEPFDEHGGYIRDRNVFGGEDKWPITAEDTMIVNAQYTAGTMLSYSLIAYCPWEGERLTITGTKGQVEYFSRGAGHLITDSKEDQGAAMGHGQHAITLQKMFKLPEQVEIPKAVGGHGGGDRLILDRIFLPDEMNPEDPLKRDATHVDGARSILTGVAANKSIAQGGAPIQLDSLVQW